MQIGTVEVGRDLKLLFLGRHYNGLPLALLWSASIGQKDTVMQVLTDCSILRQ